VFYDIVSMMNQLDGIYGAGLWQLDQATIKIAPEWVWDPGAYTYSIHKVWQQYYFDEVTWNERKTGVAWGTPGGQAGVDYDPTPDVVWDGTAGIQVFDVTTAVQSWFDSPWNYNGWLFKADNESVARNFRGMSWNGSTPDTRGPITLYVTEIPEPSIMLFFGFGLVLLRKFKKS
jgi:hypothetical protein